MADSYSIGGTDLSSVLTSLQQLDPVVIPTPAQADYVVPGRDGVVAANPWYGPTTWSIAGVIAGTGSTDAARRTDALAKLKTFAALVHNNGATYTITRVIDGTTSTATARYLGWSQQWEGPSVVRVAVDMQLMDGQFKNGGSLAL